LSTNFEIQCRGGFSASLIAGIFEVDFIIYDPQRIEFAMYQLKGVAIGVGTPLSLTAVPGPYTTFTSPKPMTVKDFWGPAKFFSSGGLDQSVACLELNPLGCMPFDVSVSTGFTLGADAWSVGAGVLSTMMSTTGQPPGYSPPQSGGPGP
jgi:hypothetical protein